MRQISAMGWHFQIVLVNDSVSSHLYQSFSSKVPVMMEGIKMASKAVQTGATGLGWKATPLKRALLTKTPNKDTAFSKSVQLSSSDDFTSSPWDLMEGLRWMLVVDHCGICCDELSLTLTAPPSLSSHSAPSLFVWWQTGTSSAVITNLIRAEVRLMRKTEASTALLINSCPIMVAGQRHWAKNETFSFSFHPFLFCCLVQPR